MEYNHGVIQKVQTGSSGLVDNLAAQFASQVEYFSQILADEGIDVAPYQGTFPSHFRSLDPATQAGIIQCFERYLNVCAQTVREGFRIKSDRQLLWNMIKKLGFVPTADMMDHIEDGDLIEIYTDDHIQIFRNSQLFPYCSYSLDDLLCRPWWQLFRRDQAVTDEIIAMSVDLYNGRNPNTQFYRMKPFYLEEVESPRLYRCLVQNKVMTPLRDKSNPHIVAGLTIAKVIDCTSMVDQVFAGQEGAASDNAGTKLI